MHRLAFRLQVYAAVRTSMGCIHASCRQSSIDNQSNSTHRPKSMGLIDVLGSEEHPSSSSSSSYSSFTEGETSSRKEGSRITLQQIVEDVKKDTTIDANNDENDDSASHSNSNANSHTGMASASGNSNSNSSGLLYKVQIADRYGMPAEIPPESPQSFEELSGLCASDSLREQLQQLCTSRRWSTMTDVQRAAIPLILEQRDILCIAPTATGKTFCYVFPAMLRLVMDARSQDEMGKGNSGNSNNDDSNNEALNRSNVEVLLKDKIARGEVCRYCELSIAEVKVCPMTGTVHPPIPEQTDLQLRPAMRLGELTSVAEPLLLILVPTSQLVIQVYHLCNQLHADFRIKYLVRANSAEEQKRYLKALQGCDVLITTPETMLPALYKHKLSLKRVKTIVLDEVDDLVSVNHFEKIKIILAALPKGHKRPQRLLFGASLPPVAYQMIKEQMLLPSHRFILVDIKTDKLGHPLVQGHSTANASITHIVFMLSQVEKMDKLVWLYKTGKLSPDQRTLIFCNSRHNVAYVCERLQSLIPNLHISTLTSRSSATAKLGTMKLFRSGVSTCLVCTDILSRGIDFSNVVYIVHYDTPAEFETWLHRTGRCGRHGMPGYCYTFFQPESVRLAKPLVAHLRQTQQMIPLKLQEYARQSIVDTLKSSLFYHPTRPYRSGDPQRQHPVMGRGTPRFPDYKQDKLNKNFRPL